VGFGSLVTYAAEAGVPVILDAGGEELKHAVGHGPDLVVAESSVAGPASGAPDTAAMGTALVRLGAGAAAVAVGGQVHAVTAAGEWTARLEAADANASRPLARGALVAGLVPGQLLGWSWPDRLRHALALAAGGVGAWTRVPGGPEDRDNVDLAAYERLLDTVRVDQSPRANVPERLSCSAWMLTVPASPTSPACSRRSPSRKPSTGC
jgi:tagatose 6-phosphate kinase